jgi:hypothetical protein
MELRLRFWALYFSITNKVLSVSVTLFPNLVGFLLNICWKLASYGLKRQWILKKQNHITTDNGKRFSLVLTLFEPKKFQLPTRCKMRLEWLDLLQAVGVLLMNIAWNPTIGSCSTQQMQTSHKRLNVIGFHCKGLRIGKD